MAYRTEGIVYKLHFSTTWPCHLRFLQKSQNALDISELKQKFTLVTKVNFDLYETRIVQEEHYTWGISLHNIFVAVSTKLDSIYLGHNEYSGIIAYAET